MKKSLLALMLPIGLSIGVSSCVKDAVNPTAPQSSTTPPTPMIGGDGSLVSLRVGTITMVAGQPFNVDIETAVAAFYNGSNTGNLIDGGSVKVNNFDLTKNDNNSYVYSSNTNLDLGFDNGSNWTVVGAGSVPAISYNHTNKFPKFSGTLPTAITRANGLTIDLTGKISGADSVYVFVASGDKSFTKHLGSNPGSVTITAAELADLPASTTGIVEVIPFHFKKQTIGGKQIAFIKEYAAVATIEIK